jgi:DNA-directed RNA polymerase specialized sigma24 family protein
MFCYLSDRANMPGGLDEASIDLVARWRQGDEQAAAELFHRYAARLLALADRRLSAKMALRADPEDVVQSAYRSFFVRARDGGYIVERSGDLWRLLVAITLHKVRKLAEFHTAGKRSVNRECNDTADRDWLGVPIAALTQDPSPAEAAALADEVDRVTQRLEPGHQHMFELRLQGHSLEEIAVACGCSVRTVKRVLSLIRGVLEEERDRP